MKNLNKVSLIGNLGKEPDYQILDGDIKVAKLSLATTESYKDKNGQSHQETEWHTVILWRSLADIGNKYLKKGSLVYVEGKIKTRKFEDREGHTKTVTEIIADELIMLDKPVSH